MPKGKIFMIPCPITEEGIDQIPSSTLTVLHGLKYFVVERSKTTRRFIKESKHPISQQALEVFELDKNNPKDGLYDFLAFAEKGISIGMISEAGCPGIADPGSLVVDWAHKNDVEVIPMVGPSSILLALMGSGMNGQNFCFNGYLPVKKDELSKRLKSLESFAVRHHQTQIFMETPYRNHGMLDVAFKTLSPKTLLCIACNLAGKHQWIKTDTIKNWKENSFDVHKKPCIFLIGSN